jgi:RNA polymerase sigma-70 factor (ECF subfamily)
MAAVSKKPSLLPHALPGSSDEDLMAVYQNGDEHAVAAFDLLYGRYSSRVFSYFSRRTKNEEAAADLFQAAFLKLHQNVHAYDRKFKFAPWMFTICRNIFLDWVKSSSQTALTRTASFEDALNDGLLMEQPEGATSFKTDISSLPPAQQQALSLRYIEDLDFDEIARRLRTSESNVRQLISRAVKKLRANRSSSASNQKP